jgi:hypothetical protein
MARWIRSLVAGLLSALLLDAAACSSGHDASRDHAATESRSERPDRGGAAAAAGAATVAAASTNLDAVPLSAADYAMYASIMSGASALLANPDAEDRKALELSRAVDAGTHKATAKDEAFLARARKLQHKDEELADLQGVGARYRQVKSKVVALIGPGAQPASTDDAVTRENRRFLEAHRANIERLQSVLRDPLSRPPAPEIPLTAR